MGEVKGMAEKTLEFGQLIQVVWEDLYVEDAWVTPKDAGEITPLKISVVGHFVNQDAEVIRVAFILSLDKQIVSSIAAIPLGSVVSIKELLTPNGETVPKKGIE
jgi:hypothetical protein